jgi:alkylation response protein AidB-like acyl-CoA dehydrogenase
VQLAGTPGQKARWLGALADGSAIGTVAFRDDGGWQPADWSLGPAAHLSGQKRHVPGADVADLIVIGTAGGGLALVERGAGGLAISVEPGIDRSRRLFGVSLRNTPADPLAAASLAVSERLRDAALVLLAADAFGGATRCLELSVGYAKTREQFGVKIGQFQALKHQLANMAVDVEPARALYWYAAHAYDNIPEAAARSAALAKAHLADRFVQAARDAVEAHGGIGYTWGYDVQILFKRALFDSAWMGAPREHRLRAAALAGW